MGSTGGAAGSASWVKELRSALMPPRVQRRAGSVRRHSRQMVKKGSGMVSGISGSSPRDLSQAGGCWVRASTRRMPSDQISAAGATYDGAGLRRVVDAACTRAPAEVRREFHLVIDNHNVGWPEMTVRKTAVVKIGEGAQNGAEHFPDFPGREGRSGRICERVSSAYSVTT